MRSVRLGYGTPFLFSYRGPYSGRRSRRVLAEKYTKVLGKAADELEKRVSERTAELVKANRR